MNKQFLLFDQRKISGGNQLVGFVILSLGIGFVSQTFPKLQIPVEYTSDEKIQPSGNGSSGGNTSNATSDVIHQQQQQQQQSKKWKVRCPFDFTDSKTKQLEDSIKNNNKDQLTIHDIHGMDRITRHPGLCTQQLH